MESRAPRPSPPPQRSTPSWRHALCLAIALSWGARAASGQSGLFKLDYLTSYGGSAKVNLYRGVSASVRAFGVGVNVAPSALEIHTASGGTATGMTVGFTGFATDPSAGGTAAIIAINSTSAAAIGDYVVSFHADVSPRSFLVHLNDRGTVSSIAKSLSFTASPTTMRTHSTVSAILQSQAKSVSSAPASSVLTTVIGQGVNLTVTGTGLEDAHVDGTLLVNVATIEILSQSSTSMAIKVTPQAGGQITIGANQFVNGPLVASVCGTACKITGSGSITIFAGVDIAVTNVSPLTPASGATVTLTGRNLAPHGYGVQLLYKSKTTGADEIGTATVTSTSATFSAPGDARPDSIALLYNSDGSPNPDVLLGNVLPLPLPVYIRVAPQIAKTDTADENGLRVIRGGPKTTLLGQNLLSTAEVFAPGTPGVTLTPTSVTFDGTPLVLQSAQRLQLSNQDQVVVTPPALTAAHLGTLVVTTAGGSVSLPNVLFAPVPSITSITSDDVVAVTLASGATLRTGVAYTAHGSNLTLAAGGTLFSTSIRVGSAAAGLNASSTAAGSAPIIFTQTSASAPMRITTLGGTVIAGTFKISPPFQLPSITSISLAPNPVVGGATTTATIAFAGPVSAGTDTAFIDIAGNSSVVPARDRIPVLSNPLVVSLPTLPQPTQTTTNVTARAASGSASPTSTLTSLVVQPLQVAQLSLSKTTTSGGHPVQATLTLNASPSSGSPVTVQVLSSNQGAASVPATVALNGQTATFTINTSVVAATAPVTISVALGGVTQTASLTVTPPVVQSISFSRQSISSFDTTTMTITLDASPVAPESVGLTSSDTTALGLPSVFTLGTRTTTLTVAARLVGATHTTVITASANGASTSASVTVVPLTLSMSLSPTATKSGVGVSATVTLSAAVSPPPGQVFFSQATSSDTTVVRNQSLFIGTLANRQTVVVFSVPTVAGLTQSKSTVITFGIGLQGASLATNSLFPKTSATLAVNP